MKPNLLSKILKRLDAPTLVCFTKIKSQVSRQIHLFLGYLTKVTAFMVTPKMIINALTFCFLIKYKPHNIIMKTEQTTIVYAQLDRWTSYNVIKDHMISTDITLR